MSENIRWNNNAVNKGFVALPNTIIEHHEELGINEMELIFLIKISRHAETFKVHDNKVVSGCQRTAQRRRSSLYKKGLLDFKEHKEYSRLQDGTPIVKSVGFTYDLSKINAKLQELLDSPDGKALMPVDGTTLSGTETILDPCEDNIGQQKSHQSPPNNTIYKTNKNTIKNSSNAKTTILESINNNALKKIFLHKFRLCYPEVFIRDIDLQILLNIQVTDFTFNNLELWRYFIDHTTDKYLSKSNSLDMLLLLKNQTRFKKELKDMSWYTPELKKTLSAMNLNIEQLNKQLEKIGYSASIESIGGEWSEVMINKGEKKIEYDDTVLRRMIANNNYSEINALVA